MNAIDIITRLDQLTQDGVKLTTTWGDYCTQRFKVEPVNGLTSKMKVNVIEVNRLKQLVSELREELAKELEQ